MPPPTTTTSNSSAVSAASASARGSISGPLSVEVGDDGVDGIPLGRRLVLLGAAKVQEPEKPLPVGQPARRPALPGPQHRGGAPVARQPARVRAQEHDVGGAG